MFYFNPRNLQMRLVQCTQCPRRFSPKYLARHVSHMHSGKLLRAPRPYAPTSLLQGAQLGKDGNLATFSQSAVLESKFQKFLTGHDADAVNWKDDADLDMSSAKVYLWKNVVKKGMLGFHFSL
jgi:hypothetical protein